MTVSGLSVTVLQNAIAKWAPKASGLSEVRLFGSALRVSTPRDLDFIVVYDPRVVPPSRASQLRAELKETIATVTSLPCDVTLFTERENSSNRLDNENAVPLWPAARGPGS